jgi:hypothetical protein
MAETILKTKAAEESKLQNADDQLDQESQQIRDQNQTSCVEEPDGDQNYHFYKEYCRLYYANIILTNRL